MTEGTLLQWLVHPGDAVHSGDVVAEVDTTKAAIEVECFDEGVIAEILVPEGRHRPGRHPTGHHRHRPRRRDRRQAGPPGRSGRKEFDRLRPGDAVGGRTLQARPGRKRRDPRIPCHPPDPATGR
ncbi:lipoyl domain-containing protein [Nocardia crassostreae]|uniref:lipoyl domain-containing protein n=1 Tax=Nocardia crassostreae TaxID=53428 RepID=UPI00350E48CF